jgi:hypothetical protein
MEQLIRKTIGVMTQPAAHAWLWRMAQSFQRERMQRQIDQLDYEMKCIKDRLKDAEMELLAVQK